jgi:hypothetical protein
MNAFEQVKAATEKVMANCTGWIPVTETVQTSFGVVTVTAQMTMNNRSNSGGNHFPSVSYKLNGKRIAKAKLMEIL